MPDAPKPTAFSDLKVWARSELSKVGHEYQSACIPVRRGANQFYEWCLKCTDITTGRVYFFFPLSSDIKQGDTLTWSGQEEWAVTEVSQMIRGFRCEVKRVRSLEKDIDELLRACGLSEATDYLANARGRLREGTPTALADCKVACRNALVSGVRAITNERDFKQAIKKLREPCGFGDTEFEYLEALERLLKKSHDVMSKAGPHPPMPDPASAAFALELTQATLRFLVTRSKSRLG